MVNQYWTNLPGVAAYLSIVLLTCLTTAVVALFCSVVFRRTSVSLMATYLTIILLFGVPLAMIFFAQQFFGGYAVTDYIVTAGFTSPFWAAFMVPMDFDHVSGDALSVEKSWAVYGCYVAFTLGLISLLLMAMIWLFNTRWRVAG